jgi:hypothetical protein
MRLRVEDRGPIDADASVRFERWRMRVKGVGSRA